MNLLSNILLTLTSPMISTVAAMIMVVIMIMANAAGVKTMIMPWVVMTVVMSMMVTMSSGFLYRWDCITIRLYIGFLLALFRGLSALWKKHYQWTQSQKIFYFIAVKFGLYLICALATDTFAVGIFDCNLHVACTDDGVWK